MRLLPASGNQRGTGWKPAINILSMSLIWPFKSGYSRAKKITNP